MDWTRFGRQAVLAVTGNRLVSDTVTRYGARLGVYRFVAGETLDQAIEATRRLNQNGFLVTLDHLGESVTEPEAAVAAAGAYLEILDRIQAEGVSSNVSLKLTQMGLDIDPDLCRRNLRRILERAREYGNFVRIDMEDSGHCQATLDLFREFYHEFKNVGVVIQAYLYRSEADVRSLGALGANLRLCKGAYLEPPSVAFPRKRDVDANFRRLIEIHLKNRCYTAVATHDPAIIDHTTEFVRREAIPEDLYEFQMLYGIGTSLQRRLVDDGYKVRIYVPFGRDWYRYFTRRLAERPANILFLVRHVFRG